MFRINNEDIRTTSISSFWYLYCYLWSYFNNFQLLFLSLISVEFIPITISAPIIQEPVHLLALEIHGLVSIWWEVLVDNGLIQLINYYCSESTINTLRHCAWDSCTTVFIVKVGQYLPTTNLVKIPRDSLVFIY